jgi:hypothetical protein
LPLVGFTLLAISLCTGPDSLRLVATFTVYAFSFTPGYQIYGLALWSSALGVLLVAFARLSVARKEGVSRRGVVVGVLLGTAPHAALLMPLAAALAASLLGQRVRFAATNRRTANPVMPAWMLAASLLLPAMVVGAGILRHPGAVLVGFNPLWIALATLSPLAALVLCRSHTRKAGTGPHE